MHYAKIDFLIVIISVITLRFVATAFLIANYLETMHGLESRNFLKKLQEFKNLQNNHYKKTAKFLMLSSCSAGCYTSDI